MNKLFQVAARVCWTEKRALVRTFGNTVDLLGAFTRNPSAVFVVPTFLEASNETRRSFVNVPFSGLAQIKDALLSAVKHLQNVFGGFKWKKHAYMSTFCSFFLSFFLSFADSRKILKRCFYFSASGINRDFCPNSFTKKLPESFLKSRFFGDAKWKWGVFAV